MSWIENVLTHLTASGHRVTSPRRAILDRIMQYNQPFSAEQLFRDLGGDNGPVGRATIYRTVELLQNDGWLAHVHWNPHYSDKLPYDHAYVPVRPGHIHHMVCRRCGSVIGFEGCDVNQLVGGIAERLGFRIDSHWLEIQGLCQNCQQK